MYKKTFLKKLGKKLELPPETITDVVTEFKSHVSEARSQNEKIDLGSPSQLAQFINKTKKLSFEQLLILPSTWKLMGKLVLQIVLIGWIACWLFICGLLVFMNIANYLGNLNQSTSMVVAVNPTAQFVGFLLGILIFGIPITFGGLLFFSKASKLLQPVRYPKQRLLIFILGMAFISVLLLIIFSQIVQAIGSDVLLIIIFILVLTAIFYYLKSSKSAL